MQSSMDSSSSLVVVSAAVADAIAAHCLPITPHRTRFWTLDRGPTEARPRHSAAKRKLSGLISRGGIAGRWLKVLLPLHVCTQSGVAPAVNMDDWAGSRADDPSTAMPPMTAQEIAVVASSVVQEAAVPLEMPLVRKRLHVHSWSPSQGWQPTANRLPSVRATTLVRPNKTAQDMALVATIGVGTPSQEISVLLDSGSSDLWIPSKHCQACRVNSVAKNRFFDAYASSTFQVLENSRLGYFVNGISYGSGAVSGFIGRDVVRLADLRIPNQSFLLVEAENFWDPQHPWDGILGLAQPSLAKDGLPIVMKLKHAGVMPIFAFVPETPDGPAKLLVGAGSYQHFVQPGTLSVLPSVSDDFWVVDAFVGVEHKHPIQLMIDTGTTLLLMPPQDMTTLIHGIAGSLGDRCVVDTQLALMYCPCADLPKMQSLKLQLGHGTFVLRPFDLFEKADTEVSSSLNMEACRLLVSISPASNGASWILGDVFLRKVVTIFNFDDRSVGFAVVATRDSNQDVADTDALPVYFPEQRGGPFQQWEDSKAAAAVHLNRVDHMDAWAWWVAASLVGICFVSVAVLSTTKLLTRHGPACFTTEQLYGRVAVQRTDTELSVRDTA